MAETTDGIPTNAGAWEYLYDLIVARRIVAGQIPLPFPFGRRLKMLATGVVKICKNPIGNPVGETIPTTVPVVFGSGSSLNNESLRTYYVRGGGTLQIEIDN